MKRTIIFLLLMFCGLASAETTICEITGADEKSPKFGGNFPRPDEGYSAKKGIKSLKLLQSYLAGDKFAQFTPDNSLSIIKGALLRKKMEEAKHRLNYYKLTSTDQDVHDSQRWYDEAKSSYCEHQRNELLVVW